MIFASFEFLFLFLPVFLAVYMAAPGSWRNPLILVFSWAFYAWWRVDFLALLVGVTVFTFYVALAIERAGPGSARGRRLMALGIVGDIGVLAYFKYANFGVQTFNDLMRVIGHAPVGWAEIVLPVGLSFYVLQAVSYLVDVQRGTVKPTHSLLDYAAYKALFSQLIAGPIVRYSDVSSDLRGRKHSLAQFGAGSREFMVGFAMKVVLADTLSPVVDAAFALPAPSAADAWLAAVTYTLQLFFDFAGYSLMAIGLGRMIGFHFPRNFDDPYLAGSIQAFWQRWHMTLSSFLRDYLYIPLGGNRHGVARTYVNLLLTMAIGGFWHGASWNFLLWGIWHGALLALHRAWSTRGQEAARAERPNRRAEDRRDAFPQPLPGEDRRSGVDRRAPRRPMPWLVGHLLTLLCVMIGWVIFRATDLAGAFAIYAGMLGLNGGGLSDALAWQLTPDRIGTLWLAIFFVYLPLLLAGLRRRGFWPQAGGAVASFVWATWPLAAFLIAMVLLYSRAAVPFLYFQF
ncbi:MBOAT family O-acyltransferase [Falsiroseomonas tokyonensis]|uniref:Probable alginate O-acetylase AlgI n=1 Tax=Falsiroseomonas tokyonensis TaxID=430521 RepID=A0ABV7BPG4_9PROT|nr:MBOAT family protein [Falsiroseomonas tokyonensis]